MDAFHRAILYIIRKKGRALLLLLIVAITASLCLVSISAQSTIDDTMMSIRQNMLSFIRLESDAEALTPTMAERIMQLDGISAYNGQNLYYLNADSFDPVPGAYTGIDDAIAKVPRFIGNTDSALHEYFQYHEFRLLEGRHIFPEDEGKAVISMALAEHNQFSLGDSFSASISEGTSRADTKHIGHTFEFTIVGIYEIMHSSMSPKLTVERDLPENFIFTDNATAWRVASALGLTTPDSYHSGISFIVDDPSEMNTIMEKMQELPGISWDAIRRLPNNKAYLDAIEPLQTTDTLLRMMILVTLVMGMALLTLILTIWTRARKREAGILLSLGIGKPYICLQYSIEVLIVLLIGLGLSFPLCAVIAGSLGETIGRVDINFVITWKAILLVTFGGIVLCMASVMIATLPMVRLNPRIVFSAEGE